MNRPFLSSLACGIGSFGCDFAGHYILAALLLVAAVAELGEALHQVRARERDAQVVRRT